MIKIRVILFKFHEAFVTINLIDVPKIGHSIFLTDKHMDELYESCEALKVHEDYNVRKLYEEVLIKYRETIYRHISSYSIHRIYWYPNKDYVGISIGSRY